MNKWHTNRLKASRVWYDIFNDLLTDGKTVEPRGLSTIELMAHTVEFPPYTALCPFEERKLSFNYLRQEWLWYRHGDRNDTSIQQHAEIWKQVANLKRPIHPSNYGWSWFTNKQLIKAAELLVHDPDTRRAAWTVLDMKTDAYDGVRDVPCTYGGTFHIRDNKLYHNVHMRSQDAFFGLGNDAPTFFWLQEAMWNGLRTQSEFSELELGTLTIMVDSFHLYERHYDVVGKLVNDTVLSSFGTGHSHVPEMEWYDYFNTVLGHINADTRRHNTDFEKWLEKA